MRIIDISRPLNPQTPVYPGDPPILVERISEARGGDTYALSRITLGSHAGTHIDAPAHFIPGGETVDRIPLDACIGPAFVLDARSSDLQISPVALTAIPGDTRRLLLRTGGPALGGAALTTGTAHDLVARGVRLVGIDALSVAPAGTPGAVHRVLLAAGIVILEGLDLSIAPAGPATLLCLPLAITGGDGAPARAVLIYDA